MRSRSFPFSFAALEPRHLLSAAAAVQPPYVLPDVMDPFFSPTDSTQPVGAPAPQPTGTDLPPSSPLDPPPTLLC